MKNPFKRLKNLFEAQRLADALASERNDFKNLMENLPDAIYFKDLSGRFLRVNRAQVINLNANSLEDVLGKTDRDFFDTERAGDAMKDDQAIMLTGVPVIDKLESIRRPPAADRWVSTTKVPIRDPLGKPTGMVGITRDITERIKREEDVQRSEELYRTTYESSPLAIVLWDLEYRIIDWNQRAEAVFGWTREEIIGKSFIEMMILPEDRPSIVQLATGLLSEGVNSVNIIRNRTKTNQVLTCEWHNTILHDRSGNATAVISLGLDITQRTLTELREQEQRHLAEALANTASVLNSSLALEQVLDCILDNIGLVVPYDAVNIMLLDGDVARIVRSKGYEKWMGDTKPLPEGLNIKEFPNYMKMIATGEPIVVPDVEADPLWVNTPGTSWLHSYACAPLEFRERTIGFINLDSTTPNFYSIDHALRLQAFTDQAAVAIENARLYTQIQEASLSDELTGLHNRRGLFRLGETEFTRSLRLGQPLTVLMMDIDHFKFINDTYGHASGDQVLQSLGQVFTHAIRSIDVVGRYGGDEFIILLIECPLQTARLVVERIRKALARYNFEPAIAETRVTLSIGLAERSPDTPDFETLLKRADEALYRAKQAGRDCVMD